MVAESSFQKDRVGPWEILRCWEHNSSNNNLSCWAFNASMLGLAGQGEAVCKERYVARDFHIVDPLVHGIAVDLVRHFLLWSESAHMHNIICTQDFQQCSPPSSMLCGGEAL